jgi:hypothetical protein
MKKAAGRSAPAKKRREVSTLRAALEKLAKKKLRGRDAETARDAINELRLLASMKEDLQTLGHELDEIENEHGSEAKKFPDQIGKVDLSACTFALDAVHRFLLRRVPTQIIALLKDGLLEIVTGASPPAAMFHPEEHPAGSRSDAHSIMAAKGILAGLMHVQQSTGMSRQEAAEWIVGNVSPTLAARISRKPLTARVVQEWLNRFGGKLGEKGVSRK